MVRQENGPFGWTYRQTHTFRLEPLTRSNEVETGLAARVHDPAWLLARQWQLGEFLGHDGGSPVVVTFDGRSVPVSAWRPRPEDEPPPPWRPYRVGQGPLDPRVEAEQVRASDRRLRLDGGARLVRLLREAGRDALVDTLLRDCGFEDGGAADDDAECGDDVAGAEAVVLLDLLENQVPDPQRVAARLDDGPIGPAAAHPVLAGWLAWWRAQHAGRATAEREAEAFDEHRFEHRFDLACGDVVLSAREHTTLGLDWFSVDATPAGHAEGRTPPRSEPIAFRREALATPVRYGGIPADRFWEMEDAQVDLSSAEVGDLDLGRMLLIGFAEVYGNDWFVVPLEVPVGSLTRLRRLEVSDTFGDRWSVGPAGEAETGWNLFAVSGTHGLLVLPSMPGQTGPELERVALARDELANTAWAVEEAYTDGDGRRVDRRGEWLREAPEPPAAPAPGRPPAYRAQTVVPPYWLPLVPVRHRGESVRFHLLPLLQEGLLPPGASTADLRAASVPRGRLLRPGQWVHEEEVPREGAVVTRRAVLSRWYDGSWHAWTRREKTTGAGESSSGLAFDVVRPTDTWP